MDKKKFSTLPLSEKLETLNKTYKGEIKFVSHEDMFDELFPGVKKNDVRRNTGKGEGN